MSDSALQPASPRLSAMLLSSMKRLGLSVLPFVVVILLWQFASLFFPRFLFPSLIDVFWRCLDIFTTGSMFADVLATVFRILAGLAGAFIVGGVLALLMVRSTVIDRFLSPILSLFQGIPALSWVVFAIIWFHGTEFRIFFIMVMTTLPAFTFQVLGALRAMSRDLMEMVFSFRPTRLKLFRVMIAPAILPDILTAWKVNLGNASRVVVVAELVGATGGVGYELLQQQQVFDMAGALAWTLQLVFFVLIVQGLLTLIENTAFKYRAVDGLDLDVRPGQMLAILGKTGCGKSTIFNMIAGLTEPTSGTVRVSGRDPFADFDAFRGKMAIVFQSDRLLPWRTAIQNVELGLEMLDEPVAERRATAQLWLTKLGLGGHEHDYPHALSGGMRQRVSIARAFATNANILLCDEPFSALDESTAGRLRAEFVRLVKENGKTAVFITHSISEALEIGDRIVVLRRPATIAYDVSFDADTSQQEREAIRSRIGEVLAA
jgi:NitT/TauT family transport system permease protein